MALALATPGAAWAYPYTPWTGATGRGVIAVNPYLSAQSDSTATINPWGVAGITDRVDVMAGYSVTFSTNGAVVEDPTYAELLPRYAFSDGFILAGYLGVAPGSSTDLGLQVHGTWANDRFMFTHNTGWSVTIEDGAQTFSTVLAPEVVLSARTWLFLEVNPTVTFLDGVEASVDLVPGVTLAIDEAQDHLVTLVVPLTPGPEPVVGIGFCYWGALRLGRSPP